MVPARVIFLALLLLAPGVLAAQEAAKPDFDKLWADGCLWEVGDQRAIVRAARKALIDAGEEGRKFLLTKLAVSDGLQTRCLNEVFAAWGVSAYEDLLANVGHLEPMARRNVADLLAAMKPEDLTNDKLTEASTALLAQARKEEVIGPRVAQLATLAKWKVEDSIPLIDEVSRDKSDRVRHRAAGLLGQFAIRSATQRLINMLNDAAFYVRDAAAAALQLQSQEARGWCLEHAQAELKLPVAEQNQQALRLLLPVIATVAKKETPALLLAALKHEAANMRADAAGALVTWKQGAGLLDDTCDVTKALQKARDAEYDPYAKAAIDKAQTRLTDGGTK